MTKSLQLVAPTTTAYAVAVEPVDWSDPVAQADWHRRVGHARAIAFLVEGKSGRAYYEVMRAFKRQVTVLGLGHAGIPGMPYEAMGPLP